MSIIEYDDEYFMRKAIEQAHLAEQEGEVPVGCVVVCGDKIISKGYNMTEKLHDSTSHAEIIAITSAETYLQSKYLKDCAIYVTLEPCVMCAGALYLTQISKIVYGTKDEKRGASLFGSLYHPKTQVVEGVLKEECSTIIKNFFRERRTN
ncbi:MAG: tRNA adenosine(34) deaminase TadA [Bacteroidales bacterium]|nr:tRNA adenosine(34) deaminase TadA [Bacteroidales bacterium]MDY6403183.1 tRNA adenosine(34) deaminase TadA [Bacteroidales bacterium]MDY6423537.1 tRNA adenosine(34) deaminase TadA [Bacteroidales bacterium]